MLLFRLIFTVVLGAILLLVPAVRESLAENPVIGPIELVLGLFALSFVPTWVAGSAPRGRALRVVVGAAHGQPVPDHAPGIPNGRRWYIETTAHECALPVSCSFVEFDERGDYLNFNQHLHAYQKVQTLAAENPHLIIVVFVHGWRNNGQSGNVVAFNEFLHQLGTHSDVGGVPHRVHGIYLAWRGAALRHTIDREEEAFVKVTRRYGGDPIVDLDEAAKFPRLNDAIETFSYFDRKGVPEHLTSGTCLSRTLFTCAHVAKRFRPNGRVFLIGHSFGGLTLERTFQNACISELIDGWVWGDAELAKQAVANPLPFDTVLLVNSAAPSIYARQFQSFMAAHRQAMAHDKVVGSNAPVFFSLTSSGDWATGKIHRIANTFCFLLPSLRRFYKGNDFILAPGKGSETVDIQQSYYYRHTPGHNPLLVNRFIEPVVEEKSEGASADALRRNLELSGLTMKFDTSTGTTGQARRWSINFPPQTSEFVSFSQYVDKGSAYLPVAWEKDESGEYIHVETGYWIIRCPAEIIHDHNDIWNQRAMDTYAALYAISLELKKETPT